MAIITEYVFALRDQEKKVYAYAVVPVGLTARERGKGLGEMLARYSFSLFAKHRDYDTRGAYLLGTVEHEPDAQDLLRAEAELKHLTGGTPLFFKTDGVATGKDPDGGWVYFTDVQEPET